MRNPADVADLLLLHKALNLTYRRYAKLKTAYESWEAVLKSDKSGLKAAGLSDKEAEKLQTGLQMEQKEVIVRNLERCGAKVLFYEDEDYPEAFRQLYSPPVVLFVRGNWHIGLLPSVSVVGTRRMSRYGNSVIQNMVKSVAEKGVTITSGLAMGVDAAAHEACLNAGGATIGILGSGIDDITPRSSKKVGERILKEGGIIMSEYFPKTEARAEHFPHRNRLVAGLSRAIVVIEAAEKSGSLITARLGVEQGKDVYAVPGDLGRWGSSGTNWLIKQGMAELLTDAEQVLEPLGINKKDDQVQLQIKLPMSEEESQILEVFGVEKELELNEIIRKSGLSSSEAMGKLTMLELKGFVKHLGGGIYQKST